ncbi:rhodanese-like domain-containing protein [Janthinobacterium sp. 17J80-10]|uniref:rhodanese-like domain-containing protein n=1 Tax=Janthinobacterium sp. 17J80-10 TaxID=2497863 RepID=UPI0010058A9E|nr:rhodanese-like domain-containing protein [Janthinobacterium sp. 17J80-10]QAU33264.1 rhodanese-like domain-containing protein [Janthinobacterium sp. 17J80-10]
MKFVIDNIWLFAVLLASGGMLLFPHLQTRGRKVTLLEATQMINQGKTVVLDVRSSEDFAAGHIRNAINIPLKDLPQRLGELEKSRSKNIIMVCQAGVNSARASAQLDKAGFKETYSLTGGLTAWQGQGLPVVK